MNDPCVFYREEQGIAIVVHGDDFTALATDEHLDGYEEQLCQSFEIKVKGRLCESCEGPEEIRILNRIVSIHDGGMHCEPDPRHCDLLTSSLGLFSSSHAATPNVKPIA